MKKFGISLALCAALSLAVTTAMPTPADAQTKKSSKSSKAKPAEVTVQKSHGNNSATYFNNCGRAFASWGWFAPVGAVGCGTVFAIPAIFEAFVWRA